MSGLNESSKPINIDLNSLNYLKFIGAPGRTRTDTGRILSPLSLPLDYGGVVAIEREAESSGSVNPPKMRLQYPF